MHQKAEPVVREQVEGKREEASERGEGEDKEDSEPEEEVQSIWWSLVSRCRLASFFRESQELLLPGALRCE